MLSPWGLARAELRQSSGRVWGTWGGSHTVCRPDVRSHRRAPSAALREPEEPHGQPPASAPKPPVHTHAGSGSCSRLCCSRPCRGAQTPPRPASLSPPTRPGPLGGSAPQALGVHDLGAGLGGCPGSSVSWPGSPHARRCPRAASCRTQGGPRRPDRAPEQPLPRGCPRTADHWAQALGRPCTAWEGEAADPCPYLPSLPGSMTSAAPHPMGCPVAPPCRMRTSSASSRGSRPSAWTSSEWTLPGAQSRRWAGLLSPGNSASRVPAKASRPRPGLPHPRSWAPGVAVWLTVVQDVYGPPEAKSSQGHG